MLSVCWLSRDTYINVPIHKYIGDWKHTQFLKAISFQWGMYKSEKSFKMWMLEMVWQLVRHQSDRYVSALWGIDLLWFKKGMSANNRHFKRQTEKSIEEICV